jgi:hypothetical protein
MKAVLISGCLLLTVCASSGYSQPPLPPGADVVVTVTSVTKIQVTPKHPHHEGGGKLQPFPRNKLR